MTAILETPASSRFVLGNPLTQLLDKPTADFTRADLIELGPQRRAKAMRKVMHRDPHRH
jgi:hypothetical protein